MSAPARDATPVLRVVLATRNPGKAREFERLLGHGFRVEPLPPDVESPEETGATFAENARLKALHAHRALGGLSMVLADDSGIEVAALQGAPGVRSARYAGAEAGERCNVALLLERLAPHADRRARFVCALVLVLPGTVDAPEILEVGGVLPGEVAHEPAGAEGFGYDPVFRPDGWVRTLGESTAAEKDAVSHRARAVRALVSALDRSAASTGACDHETPERGGFVHE